MTYLHRRIASVLAFCTLQSAIFFYERCNPPFNDMRVHWVELTWSRPRFSGILWLPIDKECKTSKITYCRSWASCGFNDRNATLQVDNFPASTTLRNSNSSIRIQVLFHSHSVVDYLYCCKLGSQGGWCCKEKLSVTSFELTIISQVFYRVVSIFDVRMKLR